MIKSTLISMAAIISLALTASTVMARGPGYGRGSYIGSGYGGIVIFCALVMVIIAVVFLVVCLSPRWARKKKKEFLLDVLKQKYARGEITKEEFVDKKRDLDKKKDLTEESLFDILDKRYARGEITKEEFGRMMQDLEE